MPKLVGKYYLMKSLG